MAEENERHPGIETEPPEMVEVSVKVEAAESYVYSNICGISVSPLDIQINFADVSTGYTKQETRIKTVVGVILTPEHAAALAILLTTQLHNYERQFGTIRHRQWKAMREFGEKHASEARGEMDSGKHEPEPPATP